MDLTKLSKTELLQKCNELGITKCKSKNKEKIIELINNKLENKIELIIETNNTSDVATNNVATYDIANDAKNTNIEKLELNTDNYNIINVDCLVIMKNIKDKK